MEGEKKGGKEKGGEKGEREKEKRKGGRNSATRMIILILQWAISIQVKALLSTEEIEGGNLNITFSK